MDPEGRDHPRDIRLLRRLVQTEAGAWGVLSAINSAFVNPLLISHGAGSVALGIYNSGVNLFGFGSGWVGPRLAARIGSVARTTLICLTVGRLLFLGVPLTLIAAGNGRVPLLMALILGWALGEGLALPLWTSFLAGMVKAQERGRWLAMRATAATAASAIILLGLAILLRFTSRESALPFAYGLAAGGSFLSLWQLRQLFAIAETPPVPRPRSVRSLPPTPEARTFLKGVVCFWFGAGLLWPVLPPYIINELDAPTAYFAIVAVISAGAGVAVQRKWGRLGDEAGAKRILLIGGIGAGIVPIVWSVIPFYWMGFGAELIAASSWPAHMMGLTLRSSELAENDADRPNLLAWTNLAQGAGSFLSPLLASVLVGVVGTIPILLASSLIRLGATFVIVGRPRFSLPGRGQRSDASTGSPLGQ